MTVIIGSDSKDFISYINGLLDSKITTMSCLYNTIPELAKNNPTAKIIVDIHSNGSMSECFGCNILKVLHEHNLNNPALLLGWLARKYVLQYTTNNTTNNKWLYNTYENNYKICQLPVNTTELQAREIATQTLNEVRRAMNMEL